MASGGLKQMSESEMYVIYRAFSVTTPYIL
jgi:hypothetical protein